SGVVYFDFLHTSFIDSSGIGLVLGRYNQLKNENRKLVLANLSKTAYKVFELSGMFVLMEYVEGVKE
ncbi:STAS domain-containing protein, partial [Thomasclavelia sp.]